MASHITVHLFHGGGPIEVVKIPGTDEHARRAARALIWERIALYDQELERGTAVEDAGVYRGITIDLFSMRPTFDSDSTWYDPRKSLDVAA